MILIGIRGFFQNGWKEAEYGSHVEDMYETCRSRQASSFLMMKIWDECKVNENITDQHREMFESRISVTAAEKLPGWEKPHARKLSRGPTTWKVMRKSALKDFVNWETRKIEQLCKVSTPC